MTLIELGIALVYLAFGVAGASLLFRPFGTIGAIIGFILGSVCCIFLHRAVIRGARWNHPAEPVCICGAQDYAVDEWLRNAGGNYYGSVRRCKNCGRRFESSAEKFYLLDDAGQRLPYMERGRNGRWYPVVSELGTDAE